MKATIKWVDGVMFLGESGSGHTVVMDGPPEAGGRNMGIRPMETVLVGLGGCASFDVVSILKKARQDIKGEAITSLNPPSEEDWKAADRDQAELEREIDRAASGPAVSIRV